MKQTPLHKKAKAFTLLLTTLMVLLLAAATLVESHWGSQFAADHIYQAPWFCALWGMLVVLCVASIVKYQLWHRFSVMMLHVSFIVILAGAFSTYISSHKGVVHLVPGVPTHQFMSEDMKEHYPLPFSLTLDSFSVVTYPGTEAAADYVSAVSLIDDDSDQVQQAQISMNRILNHKGYRLYQSSYDETGGSWLSVNYDPFGTGLTYVGYLLLALSMVMVVADRHETFRRLLHHPLLRKGALVVALWVGALGAAQAGRQLPAFNRAKADSLATRQVIYNDRVAPFNTLARDFVLKLYGRDHYHGLTPEQVISGWLLRPEVWQHEPMIQVKNAELRQLLHLEGKYARLTDFFNNKGEYLLQRYWKGGDNPHFTPNNPLQKAIADTDEKVGLIMMLQRAPSYTHCPPMAVYNPFQMAVFKPSCFTTVYPLPKCYLCSALALGCLPLAYSFTAAYAIKSLAAQSIGYSPLCSTPSH